MKKIYSFILLAAFIYSLFPYYKVSAEERKFIVTAYYSPLPDQEYYMRGNFEAEKKLQGNGVHGASGKGVFSGMLAAPKKYAFGTKIELEGLGVGVVEDRGGAIVAAGKRGYQYDRLDVWMGYGDEGLKRALAWGKRTVKGNILPVDSGVTINYKDHIAPDWAVSGLKVKKQKKLESVFDFDVGIGTDSEKVKQLQVFFRDNALYDGKIDGIYNAEMIDIVYNFQLKNEIVRKTSDVGAGYWGVKTRALFQQMYLSGNIIPFGVESIEQKDGEKDEKSKQIIEDENKIEEKVDEIADQIITNIGQVEISVENLFPSFSKTKEEITLALDVMKEIGFYKGELDISYKEFVSVVYDFQLQNEIVTSESDYGAGYFGPKTRSTLEGKYKEYLVEREEVLQKKLEEEKRKREREEKNEEIRKTAIQRGNDTIKKIGILKKGDVSQRVRDLQLVLSELGYFQEKDTAIFGDITRNAVVKFQLEYDLIDNEQSKYAGIVGERTLEKLGEVLSEFYYLADKRDFEDAEKNK